jgi:hypothetical protein
MQAGIEHETREQFVPYIDDTPDGPIYLGPICIQMPTALAHIFSDEGFVIAADGFDIVRTSDGPKVVSDHAKKIFQLPGIDRDVACSFTGMVTLFNDAGDETIFDFMSECVNAARAVESAPTRDASELAARICPLILQRLAIVKQSGDLKRYPSPASQLGELGRTLVRFYLDGYFNGQPFRTGMRFYHIDQEIAWGSISHSLGHQSKSVLFGSNGVGYLLFNTGDPRLQKYRTDACRIVAARYSNPDTAVTLQDAIEAARNFIAACSDPVALEIEGEKHQRIGGHIHIATITPKAGFQWASGFEPMGTATQL